MQRCRCHVLRRRRTFSHPPHLDIKVSRRSVAMKCAYKVAILILQEPLVRSMKAIIIATPRPFASLQAARSQPKLAAGSKSAVLRVANSGVEACSKRKLVHDPCEDGHRCEREGGYAEDAVYWEPLDGRAQQRVGELYR